MEHIPKMVDMAMEQPSPSDMPEATNIKPTPQYPYGLTLCLNDDTLSKLNMDDDYAVGDMIHFHAAAKITSCSDSEGCGKRIELQVIAMSSEDPPEDKVPERKGINPKKMYGGRDE